MDKLEATLSPSPSLSPSLSLSLSPDGNCLVHNTSGELLHKLVSAFNWSFPHLISMTTRGHIVIHYADQKGCIGVFSCNGRQFAQCALGDPALVGADFPLGCGTTPAVRTHNWVSLLAKIHIFCDLNFPTKQIYFLSLFFHVYILSLKFFVVNFLFSEKT